MSKYHAYFILWNKKECSIIAGFLLREAGRISAQQVNE